MSQIILTYKDNGSLKTMNSYTEAAKRGQITVKNIKNGIRVEYEEGWINIGGSAAEGQMSDVGGNPLRRAGDAEGLVGMRGGVAAQRPSVGGAAHCGWVERNPPVGRCDSEYDLVGAVG